MSSIKYFVLEFSNDPYIAALCINNKSERKMPENSEEDKKLEDDVDNKAKINKRRHNRGKYAFPRGISNYSLNCCSDISYSKENIFLLACSAPRCIQQQWITRAKISGVQGNGRPHRGSWGRSPPPPLDAVDFSKICKKSLKKIAKML